MALPVNSFPTTMRRRLEDVAAKVFSHASKTVLKVTAVNMKSLHSYRL